MKIFRLTFDIIVDGEAFDSPSINLATDRPLEESLDTVRSTIGKGYTRQFEAVTLTGVTLLGPIDLILPPVTRNEKGGD